MSPRHLSGLNHPAIIYMNLCRENYSHQYLSLCYIIPAILPLSASLSTADTLHIQSLGISKSNSEHISTMHVLTPILAVFFTASLSAAIPQHNHHPPTATKPIPTSSIVAPTPSAINPDTECISGDIGSCIGAYLCIASWPAGCICLNGVKTRCATACGVPIPALQDCSVDPVEVPEPSPTSMC